jgi:hypothetical protein
MREPATRTAVLALLQALSERTDVPTTVYLVGGTSAVIEGWRETTYDFTAQALAKIERGHQRDLADVQAMLARGLVTPAGLRDAFAQIEPQLYRYPAIDPETFRRALDGVLA